jgi:undecaprenyl diphosphate synthase
MQRAFHPVTPHGLHVAVIMDGNGRWAQMRGRPRTLGHRAGVQAVRRVVEAAPDAGIGTLTLYAFSADNWGRPPREVGALMRLFRAYLAAETARCVETGVRMSIVGRRDRLQPALLRSIEGAEAATAGGTRLHLRLAIDYSARESLMEAARLAAGAEVGRDGFARLLGRAMGAAEPAPDVDLLVRTGGEQRLSDFLLWECAYAELLFVPVMWPDFGAADLRAAVDDFRRRERRFGLVPGAAAAG